MNSRMFNVGPISQRSMPYWPVMYLGVDPFGPAVLAPIDSLVATGLICEAAQDGLVEVSSAHDCDLVPWDPSKPEDDLNESGPVHQRIVEIRQRLDAANVGFNMITANLHAHPMFRRGGLTNPDSKVREMAKLKVRRALRIGKKLGAKRFTYWVARCGFEVMIVVSPQTLDWLEEGLNDVSDYSEANDLGYDMGTIEPKPNEPRGHMYLPTAGHAAAFTGILKKPDFWKVNPELPQHEGMTGLDPVTCVRFLVKVKKLGFLHFGNQINGQFDNDFPPLVGPEHLKDTVEMFRVLEQLGWKDVVEFDCHALRSELDPLDPRGCRKKFIRNCSNGLGIALALADRIKDFNPEFLSESEADHSATMRMCNLSGSEITPFIQRKTET